VWAGVLLLGGCVEEPVPVEVAPQALDGASLEAVTRQLTDLGARMVATPAEEEAVARVEALFEEAGLVDVRREGFEWDAWLPGAARIEVDGEAFAALPLSPTPFTDGLTAPLVLEGADPDGAIAVVTDEGTSRGVQALGTVTAGGLGMIRVTEARGTEGELLTEVGHTFVGLSLVSLAVDAQVGEALRQRIGQPATLYADTEVVEGHTSYNLLGEVLGTGSGRVYVVAHYDSWDPSESAADNAVGVAAMVLMARRLADGPPPVPTVVFLATGAEEQGLQGALAYTDAHPAESGSLEMVLNLDVMWASEGSFLVMGSRPEWVGLALDLADQEGLEAIGAGEPTPSSDNFAFQIAGSPAFWAGRFGYREYHTAGDTVDRLDFEDAAKALRVQWGVLADAVGVVR